MFGVSIGATAWAQTHIQSYQLEKLSFAFSSSKTVADRCLVWYPLQEDQKPTVRYREDGSPFLVVRISARTTESCRYDVGPKEIIREVSDDGQTAVFEVTVRPPVTLAEARGSNFRDQLVFEAPVRRLEGEGFFEFFSRSEVHFESRLTTFITTNPAFADESARVFPIFGGNIGVPVPYVPGLIFGFAMFQNLGNFVAAEDLAIQFSEVAFELKYQFRGPESQGRWSVLPVVDFRSRNIFQTSEERPFIVGSASVPGVGVDLRWFPWAAFSTSRSTLSRIGIDGGLRYYPFAKLDSRPFKALIWDALLQYRLGDKWAVGLGYSSLSQSVDFRDSGLPLITENAKGFLLRLSLVPFEGAAR